MSQPSGAPGDDDHAGRGDGVDRPGGGDAGAVTPDFSDSGLLPAVVQDVDTGRVRMLAYMNREALERTRETGRVTFWSRSRGELWEKGESSGNWLEARSLELDCDGDALLVRAVAHGPTCHTGRESCFDTRVLWEADPGAASHRPEPGGPGDGPAGDRAPPDALGAILAELDDVVADRDRKRPEGSYTSHLLEEGPEAAGRKVAEEALEVALAAAADRERVDEESADLLYHLLVLWRSLGLEPGQVARVLGRRRGGSGTGGDDPRGDEGERR